MTHNSGTYSTSSDTSHLTQRIRDYEQTDLNTYDDGDHSIPDMEQDIDPDYHFFSNINNPCNYYNIDQFNHNFPS